MARLDLNAAVRRRQQSLRPRRATKKIVFAIIGVAAASGLIYYLATAKNDEPYRTEQLGGNGAPVPNNTYSPGLGYYHSPAQTWFPRRYGDYDSSRGYFADGRWSNQPPGNVNPPATSPRAVARPVAPSSHIVRGGFGGSGIFHGVLS